MAKLITLSGKFLDPAQRPLRGRITVSPAPEMVVNPDEDVVTAGPVTVRLKDDGSVNMELLTSVGWVYNVDFSLSTVDGSPVKISRKRVQITETTSLPDLMAETLRASSTRPVFVSQQSAPGELIATGLRIDPNDPGAVLVPAAIQ